MRDNGKNDLTTNSEIRIGYKSQIFFTSFVLHFENYKLKHAQIVLPNNATAHEQEQPFSSKDKMGLKRGCS